MMAPGGLAGVRGLHRDVIVIVLAVFGERRGLPLTGPWGHTFQALCRGQAGGGGKDHALALSRMLICTMRNEKHHGTKD